ncbi:MAG: 30S ribosomal protein S12 methylthiotransferase RimO [Chloroflexi bacterium]|nr:MAG: 30S ribosomal protein S12 methylthiotransferase RimO [Chloroflexota bacterium]
MRFYLLTLGCPKNVADSEGMAALLKQGGYGQTDDPSKADVLVVNTCGFLQVARAESESALRELAALKAPGQVLVAAGCLPQRYGAQVLADVPGIDGIIGTKQWTHIARFVKTLQGRRVSAQERMRLGELGDDASLVASVDRSARQRQPNPSAYIKIADGCSAPCAFCTIPSFKGLQKSKPAAQVIAEADDLVARGVKEIVLVAQDSTAYGRDWGARDALPELIESIVESTPRVQWLRLMYAYPGHVSEKLAETMARHPQVVRYLDVPMQHGSAGVLRRMRRPSPEVARRMIEHLRAAMPDIAIRSTCIVGYPGETESEFQELLDFLSFAQLDRVGAFTFSREPGTLSAEQPDQLPQAIKDERYAHLMEHQRAISLAKNRQFVGRELDVLIEGAGDGISVGRSFRDAPEVDGVVLVQRELRAGTLARVVVTGAMEYDLLAEVKDNTVPVSTHHELLQIVEHP